MQLTPKEIVRELDRFIVGQDDAKRAVAIALRNRYRRAQLPEAMREEIAPKNILMSGPTGVGKTEIARRLAKLVDAPFVKVEATKFTEVGYVGRDVESIVRDLVEASIRMVKAQHAERVKTRAAVIVEDRLATLIVNPQKEKTNPIDVLLGNKPKAPAIPEEEQQRIRGRHDEILERLRRGELEDNEIEIEVEETAPQMTGAESMGIDMSAILGNIMPKKMKKRKVTIAEARKLLTQEEADKLIDSPLFRPPHGLLRFGQAKAIKDHYNIVMYDLVTRDYSRKLTPEKVLDNVKRFARNGSIIVFHDSRKSSRNMRYALPRAIEWLLERGYEFRTIPIG